MTKQEFDEALELMAKAYCKEHGLTYRGHDYDEGRNMLVVEGDQTGRIDEITITLTVGDE